MNRRQRIAIFVGSLMIAAMLLFPPMSGYHPGFGFLFNRRSMYAPEFDHHTGEPGEGWVSWHINTERLTFEILIAVVLAGGVTVALGGKRE